MKLCSVIDCENKVYGKGLCNKHWQRWKKHGNPLIYKHRHICIIDGCNGKHLGRGYCVKHHSRFLRHGDPLYKKDTRKLFTSMLDAYNGEVIKNKDGCWGWIGTKKKNGYAIVSFNSKEQLAHRFSYENFIGEIPKNMFVCHHCDNPECSNPEHLFLGTPKDNTQDCINKGRFIYKVENLIHKGDINKNETKI